VGEQAAPAQTRVVWSDYGPGLEKAIAEEKPVLVSFYTDWCGYCKKMDRSTFRDPSVIETLNRMVPVRVDAEDTSAIHGYRGTELATRYRVGTFPTLVLLDSGGHEIARARGYRNAGQLLGWLKSSVERF
jgi:thiol:disulfide interchange protein